MNIKYFFHKFDFLRTYFSPFKPLKLVWYFGKIAVGTPYFLPRRWIKNKNKPGYLTAVPRRWFGFDFVGLGWKTKWSDTDYRFEWSPIISLVLFNRQLALTFVAPEQDHYWECWLVYHRNTDKSKTVRERIVQARNIFPCVWTVYGGGSTYYWDLILKKKWLGAIK